MGSPTEIRVPHPRQVPADLPRGPAFLARVPGMPRLAAVGRTSVNAVGRLLRLAGIGPQLLDPEWVIWASRARTGLSDPGVVAHPEGLAVACQSLAKEAGLGAFGQLVVGRALVEGVSNRLRYVDAMARVPQRFEVPLHRPIFVVGLPRSGTTLLHRLLCAAPNHRGIPLWEATRPIANKRDRRRWETAWQLGLLRGIVPEVMAKHAFELDSPEEAINLFEASMGWNPFLWRIAGCHSYLRWLLKQDASGPYTVFVDLLRWIAAPTPDHRMVLKTPNHLGFLDLLHARIPDAVFVRTHRDPASCIASYTSLACTMQGVAAGTVDRKAVGATSLGLWTTLAGRAARAQVPVIDVHFDELVSDPLGTVTRIHSEAGLAWTSDIRAAVAEEIERRPAQRYGKHEYRAEDYGLTDDLIRARYERATRT
jgi:hypothetical protein